MILDTIKNKLKKYTNYTLYVGFSGGADSTCVLYITNLYKEEFNYQFCAVHFNHNLRGQESDNEAIQAEKFCQKNNITYQQDFKLTTFKGSKQNLKLLHSKFFNEYTFEIFKS